MKIKSYNFLIWLLFYLIVLSTLLNQAYNHLDPDLGWHLKVGQEISETREVPHLEHFDYTLEGRTWVDHEWLSNALTYLLYEKFSYLGPAMFFSLLVIITLLLQQKLISTYISPNKNFYYLLMVLQFIGLAASLPHFGVRMQIVTLLCLQILLYLLQKYTVTRNHNVLLWLLPLFYIWSSAHAGFLIGIVITFFFVGVKTLQLISNNYFKIKYFDYSDTYTLKEVSLVASASFLSAITTLFTPYGFRLYGFLSTYTNTFYAKIISEWTPFHYLPIQYKQIFFAAIIASALSLLIITLTGKTKEKPYKINPWYFSLTLVFFVLAFKSKRHFPLFFVVSMPLTISVFYHYFSIPKTMFKYIYNNKLIRLILALVLLAVALNFFGRINFNKDPFRSELICRKNPCYALDFIKDHPEYADMKIFNNYGWGGYLIWEWPDKKLFIDGRLPQYEYGEHTLLEEYLDFFDEEKLESKLETHSIGLVLLKLNQDIKFNWFERKVLMLDEEKYNNQKIALREFLESSPEWDLVYEDKLSNVYVKNSNN